MQRLWAGEDMPAWMPYRLVITPGGSRATLLGPDGTCYWQLTADEGQRLRLDAPPFFETGPDGMISPRLASRFDSALPYRQAAARQFDRHIAVCRRDQERFLSQLIASGRWTAEYLSAGLQTIGPDRNLCYYLAESDSVSFLIGTGTTPIVVDVVGGRAFSGEYR